MKKGPRWNSERQGYLLREETGAAEHGGIQHANDAIAQKQPIVRDAQYVHNIPAQCYRNIEFLHHTAILPPHPAISPYFTTLSFNCPAFSFG